MPMTQNHAIKLRMSPSREQLIRAFPFHFSTIVIKLMAD